MLNRNHRRTAGLLTATFVAGVVAAPLAASASEEGRKNTALGLGALAAGLLLTQKNKLPGIVAAGAAAYAYKRYDDDLKHRHQREREYGYYDNDRYNDDRYNNNRYDRYDRNDNYRSGENRFNRPNRNRRYNDDSAFNYRNGDDNGSRYRNDDNYNRDCDDRYDRSVSRTAHRSRR